MKTCTKCLVEKDPADFGKNRRTPDGLATWCRECRRVERAARKAAGICSCGSPADPDSTLCPRCRSKSARTVRQLRAHRKSLIRAYKLERGCSRCGYNRCAAALDFHHLDPSKKAASPSEWPQLPKDRFLEDAANCIILCANCHREEHFAKADVAHAMTDALDFP